MGIWIEIHCDKCLSACGQTLPGHMAESSKDSVNRIFEIVKNEALTDGWEWRRQSYGMQWICPNCLKDG